MFNQPGGPQGQVPMSNMITAMALIGLLYVAYFLLAPPISVESPQDDQAAVKIEESSATFNRVSNTLLSRFGQSGASEINSVDKDGREVAHGVIDVSSGLFFSQTLTDYREDVSENSPEVSLFQFDEGELAYMFQPYARVGTTTGLVPANLIFEEVQSDSSSVVLRSTNLDTAVVEVSYQLKDQYLYSVKMRAESLVDEPQALLLGGRNLRQGEVDSLGKFNRMPGVETIWTARQGLAYFDENRVKRQAYDQIADSGIAQPAGSDWIALADKYFMSALIRNPSFAAVASYDYIEDSGYFQTNLTNAVGGQPVILAAGNPVEFQFDLFAGPKELDLLRKYEASVDAEQFAFTIDFGWFWYFTMPLTAALVWLSDAVGNVGVAILIITVIIKAFLFPIANNGFRSMARMKKLQPKMEALKEKHGDDRQAMSQATMALYREEGANPMAGCLPLFAQIPIFFALYKVIFNTLEIRHAPFFGWIQDMSVGDPTSWMNLFGLLPFELPVILQTGGLLAVLSVGVWPIAMGLTMVWQQRMSPAPTDPTQAMVMRFLPVIFTFFMATFPAGLVIYWTWNNFLSVLQQMVITRGTKTESEEKKEAETERQRAKAASKSKK